MKKRILSLVMVLCMVVAMLPVTAHAELSALYVGNTDVSTESSTQVYWKAAGEGSDAYVNTGTSDDYLFSVCFDLESNAYTLTLNGVNIESNYNYCGIYSAGSLNIILAYGKTNTITVPGIGNTYYGVKAEGCINISGGGTLEVTVNSDDKSPAEFGIYSMDSITITHGTVSVTKNGTYGNAVHASNDIRILGDADITLVDWSKGEGVDCGLHSDNGNVAIGGSASVDICSQSKGIFSRDNVYIGYVWDAAAGGGAGGYVVSGNPTVKINDAAAIAAITPDTENDFTTGPDGIWAYNGVSIGGGMVSVTGENGIYCDIGNVTITGSDTEVTASTQGSDDSIFYCSLQSGSGITITDAKVLAYQTKPTGCGMYSNGDIRISGTAKVYVEDWSTDDTGGIICEGDGDAPANVAIGGNAEVNVCAQSLGILALGSAYIGYAWNEAEGEYVASGYPTVKINDAATVAAITPDIASDFTVGYVGLAGLGSINIAGGMLEAASGSECALASQSISLTAVTILAAKYDDNFVECSVEADCMDQIEWNETSGTYKYNGHLVTYIKIGALPNITKSAATGGSYTVKVIDEEAASALAGDTVTLSATPNSGYSFSSWNVYKTGDTSAKVTVTGNTFTMPAYPVTVEAVFSASGSPSGGSSTPSKTITVTETSSDLFKSSSGQVRAEANMSNAFSDSVEVKVKDTEETASNFALGAGKDIYPFDISLYIKGTDTKTEPNNGYAVTISLPLPQNLLGQKEMLSIVHKADNGVLTTLSSKLVQNNGVWYLVFEATEFSPYALVISNMTAYDESAGVPYYIDANGRAVFIGFAANAKYLAPEGVKVLFKDNIKSFTDLNDHWAKNYIDFVTEREIFLGVGTDTFSPEIGMTRAMFATVIGRLYERSYGAIKASNASVFTDCDYNSWYGKYANWASENGIIKGYSSGLFGPDDMITREQMAAILYRFADFIGAVQSSKDNTLKYPDANDISSWAVDAALYCQATGIISGRNGGMFKPMTTATRAEVATIIKRFVESVIE